MIEAHRHDELPLLGSPRVFELSHKARPVFLSFPGRGSPRVVNRHAPLSAGQLTGWQGVASVCQPAATEGHHGKGRGRTKVLLKLPLRRVRLILMRPSRIKSVPREALGAHRTLLREGMRVEALSVRERPLGTRVRLEASVVRRPFLV